VTREELYDCLESSPIIAAVHDNLFQEALASPSAVVFLLGGNLFTLPERVKAARAAGKRVFVHIDLTDGVAKDKTGVEFVARCGADGIISTKASILKNAKEAGLLTVQRCFVYDSQGVDNIHSMLSNSTPDLMELMPGVIGKIIHRFADARVPVIAGGLIETKAEATAALTMGAYAVSTGKRELWYM
jgi:glycerol uptake operon antiterminator